MGRRLLLFILVLLQLVLPASPALASCELVVSAASSLTGAFREVETAFEVDNRGIDVVLNFASSGVLARQVAQGAPVDVLACADEQTMDDMAAKGLVDAGTRAGFATNTLVLIVPAKSVTRIASARDLQKPSVGRVAIGKPETVPAGRYAKDVLVKARLWAGVEPKLIYADSVRQVLDYVRRGEVDAGFVYNTDATAEKGRVAVVTEFTNSPNTIVYPAAVVKGSAHRDAAKRFISFLCSAKGRAILTSHGFGVPDAGKRRAAR